MKDKFNALTPLVQLLIIIGTGLIFLLFFSLLFSLIGKILIPDYFSLKSEEQITLYPHVFLIINQLPFQLGFLLIPGLFYFFWTKNNLIKSYSSKILLLSSIFFIASLFTIPLLTEINLNFLKWIKLDTYIIEKQAASEEMMKNIIGEYKSTSFYVAISIVGLITGIAEELAFRGFLFKYLLKNSQKLVYSIIVSAGVFAILHFNALQILPIFLFGVVFALIYYVFGRLWLTILFHSLNNSLNVYWIATDSFPRWLTNIELLIGLPSLLILILLIFLFYRKAKLDFGDRIK